jgi:hypothetical protein
MSITFTEENITPETAKVYLAKNHPNNRHAKPHAVEVYATDIKDGRWKVTHQGIAFDQEGNLVDGANRMRAIIQAGEPVTMVVARGLEPEVIVALDSTYRRTVGDALKVASRPIYSVAYTSILWGMFGFGHQTNRGSYTESLALEAKHREALSFAYHAGQRGGRAKGIIQGHFLGPVARAWYTADHERLLDFVDVVKSGFSNGRKDDAAIALRNWLLRPNVPHERTKVYRKTEAALYAFLNNQSLDKVYETKTELFMIQE